MLWKMLLEQVSTNTRPQLHTIKPSAAMSCFFAGRRCRGKDVEVSVKMVPKKKFSNNHVHTESENTSVF